MNVKASHIGIALIALMALSIFTVIPAKSWVYPDGTYDSKFEMFGPRLDQILIKMYATDLAEFTALENNEIDVVDWPLTKFYLDRWAVPPYSDWIKTFNYGGEAGYYILDVNNNNNQFLGNPPNPAYPNPRYPNPGSVLSMRQAIAYLANRTHYVDVIAEGMGLPMYVPIPNYMSPPLPPGVVKYEPTSRASARDLLDEDGFEWASATATQTTLTVQGNPADTTITVADPTGFAVGDWIFIKKADHTGKHMRQITAIAGNVFTLDEALRATYPVGSLVIKTGGKLTWRYWDRNGNEVQDAGEGFDLKIWGRSDHPWRNDIAVHISGELNAVGVQTNLLLRPRADCSANVFGAKDFNIYTGGWIFIGPDPDYLYDLYHSDMYWHPGKPPNYAVFPKDAALDTLLETIKLANTQQEAATAEDQFMVYWSTKAFSVPLFSTSGYKSYRVDYLGTPGVADAEDTYEGQAWYGLLNENGFGVNSWWSFLNAHPADYPMGDYVAPGPGAMTMRYGFKTVNVDWMNPVYAQWYWDWEVIGKMYDGGAARNPYDKSQFNLPQLYKRWVAGIWVDPVTRENKTSVTITVRPDVYWSDGVPFSVADVEYTLVESSKALLAKGLPPPWWYPTVQFMRSFYQIDAYTIEILLDVKSVWAMGWVIGNIVIPKHIWKPIIDASTVANNIVGGRNPDRNVIGTGPYRLKTYKPDAAPNTIILVANKPGSVVTTLFDDTNEVGVPTLSPYGYYNQEPTYLNVLPADGKFRRIVLPTAKYDAFDLVITEENREREQFKLSSLNQTIMRFENITPVNPDDPISTLWHEIAPIPSRIWHLSSWKDNGNRVLDHSDIIDMRLVDPPTGEMEWSHVEDIQFLGPQVILTQTSIPGDPRSTIWHGEWPPTLGPITDIHGQHLLNGIYSCLFHITSWIDTNMDGLISVSDIIDAESLDYPGRTMWFHVEDIWWDPIRGWMIELKEVLIVNKYVYVDGQLLPGYPIDLYLAPGLIYEERIPLNLTVAAHTIKVAFHIKNDWTLTKSNTVLPNPWHSHWENATVKIWITIAEDIGGAFLDTWHTTVPKEVPIPDEKADGKDIGLAAKAFGTVPGSGRWNPVADVTGDRKIDGKDIGKIAKMFGWVPDP